MEDKTVKYRFVALSEVSNFLDKSKPLFFDVETEKKDYGNEYYGPIRLAQFYQEGWEEVLMVERPTPNWLAAVLSPCHVVGHNVHYDITSVQENMEGSHWKPLKLDDTLLMSRLYFYKSKEHSLDKVVENALGFNPYVGEGKDQQSSNWGAFKLTEEQLVYAAKDPFYTYIVYDYMTKNILNNECVLDDYSYKLDILTLNYCLGMQWNGMPLDNDRMSKHYQDNLNKIEEIGLPINSNSYQQVRPYIGSVLSDDLGLALLVQQGSERAKAVRDTRKLRKENSEIEKYVRDQKEGVIYGKFKPTARSGRLTADDTNLQQVNKKLKYLFGFKEEDGQVLIYADYPQIQLRGACVVANDKTMERLFRNGADLHNYVAEIIFGKGFTKEQRQICKQANFGLLFGAGVNVFRNILVKEAGLYLSEDEVSELKKKWLKLWIDIAKWQRSGFRAYKKGLTWDTPLGRKYKAILATDQLAMQIQGFEAEVAKLAWHYMLPALNEKCPDVLARNFVHDSYIFSGPNDEKVYKKAAKIIKDSMDEAWFEMSKSVAIKDLPMPNKVRVGFNWGDIEKDNYMYELA